MRNKRILTLLTDFGLSDVYVGVIKGVIAQINPEISCIDLTHEIPPQNLAAARFALMNAYAYFPSGTVHLAVVDPGVGSKRRAIALSFAQGFLVGPDNGLFSGVLGQSQAITAVELTNTAYWRSQTTSATFHGRDIFAPVAAHLASGVDLRQLGTEIDCESLVQLAIPECIYTATTASGCIQYIDTFGNLVTNIPGNCVQNKTWETTAAGKTIPGCQTYSDTQIGSAMALIGSHGWVEIAVNCGNAQAQLQLKYLDRVQVKWGTPTQL